MAILACALLSLCCCFVLASASHHFMNKGTFFTTLNVQASQSQPYRTGFHFQPTKNWMNDPNGLMFYKGYYHLFYQWNPYAAVWGNITWGHAVSTDMLNWRILQLALVPDQWYDLYGCWSGSATIIGPDKPVLLYTGWSNVSFSRDNQVQMQAMAVPENSSDPLLEKWRKIEENPILVAPTDINSTKFRDPTEAWIASDGKWRMLIGAKRKNRGLALLYKSSDFVHWEQAKHPLHSVPRTGMWECPDLYPILVAGKNGIETSANGHGVMHVLKVSLDDTKHDYYTVGTYVSDTDSFLPANAALDAGIGLQYDYGKFYASKTFYDSGKGRRILIGWVNESSSSENDIGKGWSSLQGFPRQVWLDGDTKNSLLQWPIEEIESLRRKSVSLSNVPLKAGSLVEVRGVEGTQLDVEVEFDLPRMDLAEALNVDASNVQVTCSNLGASRHGALGPFGLLVLASDDHVEQTALFFYIVASEHGWKALVCSDQSRSSLARDLDKTSYGSYVSISQRETSLRLRVLVDHSIVESFAQGGKVCITSRVYPTKAINNKAHLYLFNNGTASVQVRNLLAWEMASAKID
ncbi:hypothetical protein GOP47_0003974 [Adiantum capillus-veneris]|uniref:Beta-fructofuranosidase n=1 Tax=Adiantum capillus-veneris TaxID=13818 RepID=A0A9D4V6N1_ADICA|nr:hypothetical protein GOP47_0003974 [Adiantum capillus-veneris]